MNYLEGAVIAYREALDFAKASHGNQMYGDKPYIHHVIDVASVTAILYDAAIRDMLSPHFSDYPHSKHIVQAALLHDVIEDTNFNETQLERKFGPEVASMVASVSDPAGPSRKKRKQAFNKMWADNQLTFDMGARVIKIADRICNHDFSMEQANIDKITMYLGEYPTFKRYILTDLAMETEPAVRNGAAVLEAQIPLMISMVERHVYADIN